MITFGQKYLSPFLNFHDFVLVSKKTLATYHDRFLKIMIFRDIYNFPRSDNTK